ncbi:hypothetical protein ACHAWF_010261 [Thalassiosira exigua]
MGGPSPAARDLTPDASSRRESAKGRLRVPVVQTVASAPHVPAPSSWDVSRDAVALAGRCARDSAGGRTAYEVALSVKCYPDDPRGGGGDDDDASGGSIWAFRGTVVDASDQDSGGTDVRELALPPGARSAADLSWSAGGDLVALLQMGGGHDGAGFDGDAADEGAAPTAALARYSRDARGGWCATEPTSLADATLPRLDPSDPFGGSFDPTPEEELDLHLGADADDKDDDADPSSIAAAEADVDRAGLLALLRPAGKSRPPALAVRRSLYKLGLLESGAAGGGDLGDGGVRPAVVLAAIRRWKKRDAVSSSWGGPSFALVALDEAKDDEGDAGVRGSGAGASAGSSVYQAFCAAGIPARRGAAARASEAPAEAAAPAGAGAARRSHRSRWVRLLSEVRRQASLLDAALSLGTSSCGVDVLVRGGGVYVLSPPTPAGRRPSALDELSTALMERATKEPELRGLLRGVEALLRDSASRAAPLIEGWSEGSQSDRYGALLSQLEILGSSAMKSLDPADPRIGALNDMTDQWLASPLPWSVPSLQHTARPTNAASIDPPKEVVTSASALVAAWAESTRCLFLSRVLLVFSGGFSRSMQHHALRPVLHATALSWAINEPSSTDVRKTVLEVSLANGPRRRMGLTDAQALAESFIEAALRCDLAWAPPFREPRAALRLLAPLVTFPMRDDLDQARREAAARCLLMEAALVGKSNNCNTPPEALWAHASQLLLPNDADASNVEKWIHRATLLEQNLTQMDGQASSPLCCKVVLSSIQDARSRMPGKDLDDLTQKEFDTAIRGHLWDDALIACVSHSPPERRDVDLKRLVLAMVDHGCLGKLIDMGTAGRAVAGRESTEGDGAAVAAAEINLFALVAKILEGVALETPGDGHGTDYWGCLYALHASRKDWRNASAAMDARGKSMAAAASSASKNSTSNSSRAAAKIAVDEACLSAQASFHAMGMVEDPSQRYLYPGPGLLMEKDLECRAVRASALRTFSMDEYSLESAKAILESDSRETIDSLARLGYYDQAIAVASGVASKRNGGMPRGVDMFDDALRHILATYLVPVATDVSMEDPEEDSFQNLQSRSKIAQIRAASSACRLKCASDELGFQPRITSSSANSKSWVSNSLSGKMLQATMAMDLLQQYTTSYSKRCRGLALHVADAVLQAGDGASELPLWLKDLCMLGIPVDGESQSGLFAGIKAGVVANPAGLMRLYIKHHRYGEACDVVAAVLSRGTSRRTNASSRLPEKGDVDFVPYDLIDMLWNMIESIVASNQSNISEDVQSQVKALVDKRGGMERALTRHFESLKISEDGLKSARALSNA